MHTIAPARKKEFLMILFVVALIMANILWFKLFPLMEYRFSVAIIAFPLTFLITDAIAEVYGAHEARKTVYYGIWWMLLAWVLIMIARYIPPSSLSLELEPHYDKIFGEATKFMLASIVAFMVSQSHDVWAFERWKKRFADKFLWLRNNASTIISQTLDTIVFYGIAFVPAVMAGDRWPNGRETLIFRVWIPYLALKIIAALIDTPLVYVLVSRLRKWSHTVKEID